jgi:DNA-binding transcriptional LysR family regulator
MPSRRNQLQYLITVAEEGQITRAANVLGVAQPVLSQAIAQLESEVGIELLVRRPRGVALTRAGEAFLAKARLALAAETEAAEIAAALARAARGALAVGFIGPPPAASTPGLFSTFLARHSEASISFQDLPFPRGTTSRWLADVDVALCQTPALEPGICAHPVRVEPRAVVANKGHSLAARERVSVEDVLDAAFIGFHPEVQPEWAGFHCLDDHRGAPPKHVTTDHVLTSLHMLGIMSSTAAITTVPEVDARVVEQVLGDVVVIPLRDADPAVVSLVWREENRSPLLQALVTAAHELNPDADGV